MIDLPPLESFYDATQGTEILLPPELASRYGELRFPRHPDRPHVISNFVSTLDGVVSLGIPGQSGGGEISGFNQHDRMVMGILRAVSDAVVVGAGTLRAIPRHLWTAEYIYPPLAQAYQRLRATVAKAEPPLNVVVTAQGEIDLAWPVFRSGDVPSLIVTTERGARHFLERALPPTVRVKAVGTSTEITARQVLDAITSIRPSSLVLVEGGPKLLGDFFAEGCLDELFLTLAPQVAGRDGMADRPGIVAGKNFAPERPLWGTLVSLKRADSHLFLRYAFPTARDRRQR
jgi:riboflavin biosynthesis pyrimidine reductase